MVEAEDGAPGADAGAEIVEVITLEVSEWWRS